MSVFLSRGSTRFFQPCFHDCSGSIFATNLFRVLPLEIQYCIGGRVSDDDPLDDDHDCLDSNMVYVLLSMARLGCIDVTLKGGSYEGTLVDTGLLFQEVLGKWRDSPKSMICLLIPYRVSSVQDLREECNFTSELSLRV